MIDGHDCTVRASNMRHSTPESKTAMQCTYTYSLAIITKNPSGGRWDKKRTTENSRTPTKVLTYVCSILAYSHHSTHSGA